MHLIVLKVNRIHLFTSHWTWFIQFSEALIHWFFFYWYLFGKALIILKFGFSCVCNTGKHSVCFPSKVFVGTAPEFYQALSKETLLKSSQVKLSLINNYRNKVGLDYLLHWLMTWIQQWHSLFSWMIQWHNSLHHTRKQRTKQKTTFNAKELLFL